MWTINDFVAYVMLSSWSTIGSLACPYCMSQLKAFNLKYGGKYSWFDLHHQFLPLDSPYRRNKDEFLKNRVEKSQSSVRLFGNDVWEEVSNLSKITEIGYCTYPVFGLSHNQTKQSIHWELPYWKINLIRYNLDIMYIKKNVFDNGFNTVMDIQNKMKDNVKVEIDLKEYCWQKELELHQLPNRRYLKSKAKLTLSMDQKKAARK